MCIPRANSLVSLSKVVEACNAVSLEEQESPVSGEGKGRKRRKEHAVELPDFACLWGKVKDRIKELAGGDKGGISPDKVRNMDKLVAHCQLTIVERRSGVLEGQNGWRRPWDA